MVIKDVQYGKCNKQHIFSYWVSQLNRGLLSFTMDIHVLISDIPYMQYIFKSTLEYLSFKINVRNND